MAEEATIDKLVIEVSSTASQAIKDISALAKALSNLETHTGANATKLREVSNSLISLQKSVNKLKFDKLKELSNIKISKSLTTGLTAISNAVKSITGDASDKIKSLTALNELNNIKLNASVGNTLTKISSALRMMPADTVSKIHSLAELRYLENLKISSSIPSSLQKIAVAVTAIPLDAGKRLAALTYLSTLNGLKISSSISTNLHKIAQSVIALPDSAATKLKGLVQALTPLVGLQGLRLTGITTMLRDLPAILRNFQGLDITSLIQQLDLLIPRLVRLAQATSQLSTALRGLPSSFRNAASSARNITSANRALANAFDDVSAGSLMARVNLLGIVMAARMVFRAIANCVNQVNTYIEDMNLFNASMGEYTEQAIEYGQKVQDAMGIDLGQWARNQGVFMTLMTGMGETAERASIMSQQLTQLGYDISSFYNLDVNDAMLKIQSGIAGELEPLRRIGWDLSDVRMNAEAAALGIDKTTREMSQAEKVALRYHMIMTQVTTVHGDMARTIMSPANQLRVLQSQINMTSREIGNLFIPMLNMILPYAIGAAKAIRHLAQTIANFFGIDATFEVDYSTLDMSGISSGVDDLADSLEDAGSGAADTNEKLKELKNTVMGFDELNKLNDQPSDSGSGGGGAGAGAAGGGSGFDIPLEQYDFMKGLTDEFAKKTDEIAQKMQGLLPIIGGIGTAFATWKIGNSLYEGIQNIKTALKESNDHATNLGKNLSKLDVKDVTTETSKLSGLWSGLGSTIGGIVAKIGPSGPAALGIAAVAAIVGALVWDFSYMYDTSENFATGVGVIGDVFSGWLVTLPSISDIVAGITGAFSELGTWVGGILDQFSQMVGIDLTPIKTSIDTVLSSAQSLLDTLSRVTGLDVNVLALNLGALTTPLAPLASTLLALNVGISLVGAASNNCSERLNALAGVSETTSEKLGTALTNIDDVFTKIATLDFGGSVVTQDDVDYVDGKTQAIADQIIKNLDVNYNTELANIDSMSGFLTEEEIAAAKKRVEETWDNTRSTTQGGTQRIKQILSLASLENRRLTTEESTEIQKITDTMYATLINTSSASTDEIYKIEAAMNHNRETSALLAAASVIRSANTTYDETVASAGKTRDDLKAIAKKMYENGDIDKTRYKELCDEADKAYNTQVTNAENTKNEIVNKVGDALGESAIKINTETGEIKTNWDIWTAELGKSWETMTNWVQSKTSDAWMFVCGLWGEFSGWWTENVANPAEQIWNDVCTSVQTWTNEAWMWVCGVWGELSSWFDTNIGQPVGKIWDDLCNGDISAAITDSWMFICDIWGGITGWVDTNIVQPVTSLWNDVSSGVQLAVSGAWLFLCGVWSEITGWVNENIIQPVTSLWEGLFGENGSIALFATTAYVAITSAWYDFKKWFDGIITPVKNFFKGLFGDGSGSAPTLATSAHAGVIGAWSDFKKKFEEPITSIKSAFQTTFGSDGSIVRFVKQGWSGVTSAWSTFTTWFDGKVNTVKGYFEDNFGENGRVRKFFADSWTNIKGSWEVASGWFNNNVTDPIKRNFENAFGTNGSVRLFFSGAWTNIQKAWESANIWFYQNIVSPIEDNFDAVFGESGTVPGWFSTAWSTIEGVWTNASHWFWSNIISPIQNNFQAVFGQEGTVRNWLSNAWGTIQNAWNNASSWFWNNVISPIQTNFQNVFGGSSTVRNWVTGAWNVIQGAWTNASNWFWTTVISPIQNNFQNILGTNGTIRQWASSTWSSIKSTWEWAYSWFFTNVISPISNLFDSIFGEGAYSIRSMASNAWTAICNFFSDPWGTFAAAVDNTFIRPFREFFQWFLPNWAAGARSELDEQLAYAQSINMYLQNNRQIAGNYGAYTTYSVYDHYGRQMGETGAFAAGGFPDQGQLFIAREAGPEYVGTIGDRTAVANNQQIVEGIEAGVTNALVNVLMTQNTTSRSQQVVTIPLYVDRREIARAVWEGQIDMANRGEITVESLFR